MKLLITIVQDEDANRLMDCLNKEGFQFTKISSTGGFLREGSTTLLIGVKKDKMDRILSLVKETSCAREYQVDVPVSVAAMGGAQPFPPTRVTSGGAVIFIMDVEKVVSF